MTAVPQRPPYIPAVLVWVGLCFLLFTGPIAHAADEAAAPATIHLTVAGSPEATARIEADLRDSLSRRHMSLETTMVATFAPREVAASPGNGTAVSLWLDLKAPRRTLYVVDERRGLIHSRELTVGEQPDSVELAVIRFVVESSVDAIAAGQVEGQSREEFQRALDAPASPRPKPQPPSTSEGAADQQPLSSTTTAEDVSLAAGYRIQLVDAHSLGQGLLVSGRWQPGRFALEGSAHVGWPMRVTGETLDLRFWSTSLRLHACLRAQAGDHTFLLAGLGGGVETSRVAADGPHAVAPFWASTPLLSAFTAVEHALGGLLLSFRLDLDGDLIEVRYEIMRDSGANTEWRPYRLRVSAALLAGGRF